MLVADEFTRPFGKLSVFLALVGLLERRARDQFEYLVSYKCFQAYNFKGSS